MSFNDDAKHGEQMELIPQEDLTFPKNIALANPFGLTNPTLRKQNCLHALQYAVREQFMLRNPIYNESNIGTVTEEFIEKSSVVFDVPEEQIMATLGYLDKSKYYSLTQVLELFEEIANESIGFDSLGVARSRGEKDEWIGFTKIIASVERKGGCFRFTVPPKIVYRIVNPKLAFQASLDWHSYNNKYTPSLYETCMFHYQQGLDCTDWIPVEKFRVATGASYTNYPKLKDRVVNKALKNINSESSLELHVDIEETYIPDEDDKRKKRVGRKPITHVRFKIRQKVGAIRGKGNVRSEITLASQKTELRSLGVAANQVAGVFDEIRDEKGALILPYLSWCIRRGHELISFREHAGKDLNMFGGYFRVQVVRGCKDEWLKIERLLSDYISQNALARSNDDVEVQKRISELRERVKSGIADKFVRGLSENAFVFLKDEFCKFLEDQLPPVHKKYLEGGFGHALTDLDPHGKYYLNIYLDHKNNLFTYDAYVEYLSSVDKSALFKD